MKGKIFVDKTDNLYYHYYMNYLIRKIDNELWKMVKIKAAKKGITIRQLVLDLLEKEIKKEK